MRIFVFAILVSTSLNLFAIQQKDGGIIDLKTLGKEKKVDYASKISSPFVTYTIDLDFFQYALAKRCSDSVFYTVTVSYDEVKAISFFFSEFLLPENSCFCVVSNDNGQHQYFNPTNSGTLATLPFDGSVFSFIVTVPLSESDLSSGQMFISLGAFGVLPFEGRSKAFFEDFVSGEYCQVDVACDEDAKWRTISSAVCKIFANNSLRCTGTLMNNTAEDGALYVLTANHCVKDSIAALNSVFTFNYENEECNGSLAQSISVSGARLLATSPDRSVDFTLLKLLEPIPGEADVFFAGWDVSDAFDGIGTAIHHPHGDVKKISHSYSTPEFATFQDSRIGYSFVEGSFWRIAEWESGVTSGGSSGGSLFDDKLRVRGTLTGGAATCDYPKDDFYQRMSYSWDYFVDSSQQLKYWLDPIGSEMLKIDGKASFSQCFGYSDSLCVLKNPECVEGYVFGSNCAETTEFGRYINNMLASIGGVSIPVGPSNLQATDTVYLCIYNIVDGDKLLVETIPVPGVLLSQNAYNHIYFDKEVVLGNEGFISIKIPAGNKGSIAFYSSEVDSCTDDVELKYGRMWFSSRDLGIRSDLHFCLYLRDPSRIGSSLSIVKESDIDTSVIRIPKSNSVNIYPTIVSDGVVRVSVDGAFEKEIDFSIYDLTGKLFANYTRDLAISGNTFQIDIHTLPAGSYVLKTYRSRVVDTKQFTVVWPE